MKRIVLWAAVVGLAAAAWGADVAVEAAAPGVGVHLWPAYDGERELGWDSGTRKYYLSYYYGPYDLCLGNDFDVGTISSYDRIKAIRVLTTPEWPNDAWDGLRFGIYLFSGTPAKLLWPTSGSPYFFKFTGPAGWKDAPVDWVLPRGVTRFLAGVEQYYKWPNADPYAIDDNTTFTGHSWKRFEGKWYPFEEAGIAPYRNVMIRVVVSDANPAVAPTSLGRVKALYY
jgi:hypothetical protein